MGWWVAGGGRWGWGELLGEWGVGGCEEGLPVVVDDEEGGLGGVYLHVPSTNDNIFNHPV